MDHDALKKLIEAVENGTATKPSRPGCHGQWLFFAVFPPTAKPHDDFNNAHDAYNGSLDAAKALHEKMLPGWIASIGIGEGDCIAMVGPIGKRDQSVHTRSNGPARSWLLAILRAHLATMEAQP